MPEATEFSLWKFESLVALAADQAERIRQLELALEQSRLDLRDAMGLLRGKLGTAGPTPPPGYTADELDKDNPYNQWMNDK